MTDLARSDRARHPHDDGAVREIHPRHAVQLRLGLGKLARVLIRDGDRREGVLAHALALARERTDVERRQERDPACVCALDGRARPHAQHDDEHCEHGDPAHRR